MATLEQLTGWLSSSHPDLDMFKMINDIAKKLEEAEKSDNKAQLASFDLATASVRPRAFERLEANLSLDGAFESAPGVISRVSRRCVCLLCFLAAPFWSEQQLLAPSMQYVSSESIALLVFP